MLIRYYSHGIKIILFDFNGTNVTHMWLLRKVKADDVGEKLRGTANTGKSYVRNSKSNQNIVWISIFNIRVYVVIYEIYNQNVKIWYTFTISKCIDDNWLIFNQTVSCFSKNFWGYFEFKGLFH